MAFRTGSTTGNSESLQDKCFKLLVQPDRVPYVLADLGMRDTVHPVLGFNKQTTRMHRTDFEVPQNTFTPNRMVCSLWRAGSNHPGDSGDSSSMFGYDLGHSWQQEGVRSNTILVYCHSQSGCRVEGSFLVEYCAQRKMDLLLFDFPGCGQSSGDYVTLGWNEAMALSSVIEYVQQHFQAARQKIVLWGRSMGSVAVMRFITHESALLRMSGAHVVGLILDSPYADLMELTRYTAQTKLNIPSLLLSVPIMILSGILKERVGLDLLSFKPIDMAPSLVIPTLFLVAKGDKLLPKNTVQRIYSKCQSQMKLMEYCEGEHGSVRDQDTVNRIFGFVDSICPVELNHHQQQSRSTALDESSQGNSSIQKGITSNILSTSMAGPQVGGNASGQASNLRNDSGVASVWRIGDGSIIRDLDHGPELQRFPSAVSYISGSERLQNSMRVTSDHRDTSTNRQSTYFDPFLREASSQIQGSRALIQRLASQPDEQEARTTILQDSRPKTKIDLRQQGLPRPQEPHDVLATSILASSGLRDGSFINEQNSKTEAWSRNHQGISGVRSGQGGQKKINPLLRSFNQQPTPRVELSIDQRLADSPITYKNSLGSASATNIGVHRPTSGMGAESTRNKFKEFMHDMNKSNTLENQGNPLRSRIFSHHLDSSHHDYNPRIVGFGDSKPFMMSLQDNQHAGHPQDGVSQHLRPSLFTEIQKQQISGPKISPVPIQSLPQNNMPDLEPQQPQMLSPQSKILGAHPFQAHSIGMKSLDLGRTPLFRQNPVPIGGFKQNKGSHFFNSIDLSAIQQSSTPKGQMPVHMLSQSRIHGLTAVGSQGFAKASVDRPQSTLMDVFQRKGSNNQTDQPVPQTSYSASKDPYLLYSHDTRKTPVVARQPVSGVHREYSLTDPSMNQSTERGFNFEQTMQNAGLAQPQHLLGNLSVNTLSEFRGVVASTGAPPKTAADWKSAAATERTAGWVAPATMTRPNQSQAFGTTVTNKWSSTARQEQPRNPLLAARLTPAHLR